MLNPGRIMLVVVLVVAAAVALPLPNHLKAVVVDTDLVPKGSSVSASFGGYSAKAGLGGSGSDGGLFASADSPHGSASTDLGGSLAGGAPTGGLGASASTGSSGATVSTGGHSQTINGGHKPYPHQGPGLFDGIFNIPISVLQSVNTYLNNRGPITKPIHRRRGHQPTVDYKTVTPEQVDYDKSTAGVSVAAGTGSEAHSSGTHVSRGDVAGGQLGQGQAVLQKRVNYDDIFNIPISALKSVNQFLNGKK